MAVISALIKLPRPVWGIFAAVVIVTAAYRLGALNKAAKIEERDNRAYHETLDRIDRATGGAGDADTARHRLRDAVGPWPGDL